MESAAPDTGRETKGEEDEDIDPWKVVEPLLESIQEFNDASYEVCRSRFAF